MDDVTSLDQAERILAYLKIVGMLEPDCSPCILVANKTDLVRNRVVKSSGGISIMLIPFNGRVFHYKMSCYMNFAFSSIPRKLLIYSEEFPFLGLFFVFLNSEFSKIVTFSLFSVGKTLAQKYNIKYIETSPGK